MIPFYATLAVDTKKEESEDIENMGKVVEILRLMRIFQILKLAWHYVGLWSLAATLRHSYHEVGPLLLFLFVAISIFSVLIYSVEKDDHMSGLTSIPICWRWATSSLTTVVWRRPHSHLGQEAYRQHVHEQWHLGDWVGVSTLSSTSLPFAERTLMWTRAVRTHQGSVMNYLALTLEISVHSRCTASLLVFLLWELW